MRVEFSDRWNYLQLSPSPRPSALSTGARERNFAGNAGESDSALHSVSRGLPIDPLQQTAQDAARADFPERGVALCRAAMRSESSQRTGETTCFTSRWRISSGSSCERGIDVGNDGNSRRLELHAGERRRQRWTAGCMIGV